MEQAVVELLAGGRNRPDISAGLRIAELVRYSQEESEQRLRVRDLERYVVHLQCEDPLMIRAALKGFSERSERRCVRRPVAKQVQTSFSKNAGSQFDPVDHKSCENHLSQLNSADPFKK